MLLQLAGDMGDNGNEGASRWAGSATRRPDVLQRMGCRLQFGLRLRGARSLHSLDHLHTWLLS